MSRELDTALKELDTAIGKAIAASNVEGILVDWVVCIATRVLAEDDSEVDEHQIGYLVDSTSGVPDYRAVGLLESVRDIFRTESSPGESRDVE
jgi:hypothetical protein